jgi:hypothetical protein
VKIETGLEAAAGLVETCSTTALLLEVVVLAAGCIIGQARIGPQHRVVDAHRTMQLNKAHLGLRGGIGGSSSAEQPNKKVVNGGGEIFSICPSAIATHGFSAWQALSEQQVENSP